MSSPLPFLPFALPEIGDEEIAEVVDTLKSGWVTTGPKAKRFETAFAEYLGDPQIECIAVNSATAGLHLALEAIGIGPGDEVITTTHTFTATAEVVRYLGADVRLVDIDPKTLNIDLAQVDLTRCGLTQSMKIADYAQLRGIKVANHNFTTDINTAASLHFLMGPGGMASFGHAAWFGIGAYGAALAGKGLALPMAGGLEADLVFLSLRNTSREGFLDSPNRLNVAIIVQVILTARVRNGFD